MLQLGIFTRFRQNKEVLFCRNWVYFAVSGKIRRPPSTGASALLGCRLTTTTSLTAMSDAWRAACSAKIC